MYSKHLAVAALMCPICCCSDMSNLTIVLFAEEAHKLEIAAKEAQIVHFRQDLNVIVEELEAMKQMKG